MCCAFAEVIRHLDGVDEVADSVEPGDPPPSQDQLYQQRPIYTVAGNEEIPPSGSSRLSTRRWTLDNYDNLVGVSLAAVTHELLPDLVLPAELSRLLRGSYTAELRFSSKGPVALLPSLRDRRHFSLPAGSGPRIRPAGATRRSLLLASAQHVAAARPSPRTGLELVARQVPWGVQ